MKATYEIRGEGRSPALRNGRGSHGRVLVLRGGHHRPLRQQAASRGSGSLTHAGSGVELRDPDVNGPPAFLRPKVLRAEAQAYS